MEELHLFIYGEIGGDPMLGEAAPTPDEIQEKLLSSNSENVTVHISSPGGGVFKGWTIGNIISHSGKNTTALIEGYCGSISTFIALSCDRVEMAEAARFMIHNPTFDPGSVEEKDLEAAKEQLATIKDDLLTRYRKKTGMSLNQLSAMMDKETSMTQEEALKFGFVDGKMIPLKAVAKFDIKNKDMLKVEKKPVEGKVDLSVLDKIIAKAKELLKPAEAKNVTVQLADGGAIFVESEDEELEGKNAFTVDEEGNPTETPVEDGTFTLDDGRSLTVEGGVVTSVQEAEPEEVDILRDQVAKLEAQIKDSEGKEKEAEKEKEATDKTVTELILDVENYKKMTAGDTGKLKKPINQPKNKFSNNEPEDTHPLAAFAKSLNISKK